MGKTKKENNYKFQFITSYYFTFALLFVGFFLNELNLALLLCFFFQNIVLFLSILTKRNE